MALTEEERRQAIDCKIRLRRHVDTVRRNTSGRMDPKGLAWHQAAEFAGEAHAAGRWIGYLLGEVERLRKQYEPGEKGGG